STPLPKNKPVVSLNVNRDRDLLAYLKPGHLKIGSNNWATAPALSPGGKPILANDPHLDARMLPGPWYPCGLITPEMRFIGVGIPGTPSLIIGRNAHIAIGVTNSYGDQQDLYIETLDPNNPDHYLEGGKSIPFKVIEEKLRIRDKKATEGYRVEILPIKMSKRGPVVSGVLPGLKTGRVVTLRWAPFETMGPSLGLDKVQSARSVVEIREALKEVNWIGLNFVFADTGGNIGWQTSGRLPLRSQRESTLPFVVADGRDNWNGWIPYEKMPGTINPQRGWVGTCNHNTLSPDFPFYYSSHLSPSYRYRRLSQLLNAPGMKSAADHWRFQRDTLNLMAQQITPIMVRALKADEGDRDMAQILEQWNFEDDPQDSAPTLFQALYRKFAFLVFSDELGEELAQLMLGDWYFWQERVQSLVLKGDSHWFDNLGTTDRKETMSDLFRQAAVIVKQELGPQFGHDPKKWTWGKVHQLELVHPIRRKGTGKGLLGGGSHPMGGSGETLYRAVYEYHQPFGVVISASLRMVVDLADNERILAVLPGGISARRFDPHFKDQVKSFMNGDKLYWWFSDRAIKEHTRHTLLLNPAP
ncbi:MAG: penicillin acylase family protein, partial [Thermodesulfobacteriota bacterium]